MTENIFFQLSVLLGITVSIAVVIRLLRQPFIVAYIIAGIVAGPLLLNLIQGNERFFQSFSEFGVVLLLFIVGLSLDFRHIKRVGRVAITTGLGQLFFTAFFGFLLLRGLGLTATSAIYLAIATTFSSTIIVIKLLTDKKALESVYGRYTVGLLLVQDLCAIFIMIFAGTNQSGSILSSSGTLLAKGIVLLSIVYFLSRAVLPIFLEKIAQSSEFLFLFTLSWCFGIASMVYWIGFSVEIGAVVAGISLGSSPYHFEIASRIKPLRDFFIVLFFIILGSQLGFSNLKNAFVPSLVLSLFILVVNPIILFTIYRLHKFTRRNSFLGAVTAAQVSEFGFIMLFNGLRQGQVTNNELAIFTISALITIFISSYLITYNEHLYRFLMPFFQLFGKDTQNQTEDPEKKYDVWVVGYHRIGWKICEMLTAKHLSFAVIDYNPEAIAKLHRRGIPAFFGDIADVEFLDELSLSSARLIILTVPEPDPQLTLLHHLRHAAKKPFIIGNLYHSMYLKELYAAGADYVMMPHLLGGRWITDILSTKPWTKHLFRKLHEEQTDDMKLRIISGT